MTALGVALGAVVVLDDGGIDHPDEWDERVVELVGFVERVRGLSFEHPVTVEFLTEDEYSDRARVDEATLTDEDRDSIEEAGTVFEALGLLPAGIDLLDTSNEMADTGTLAFYDPMTETVTVRGTEMTAGIEVTLVHELVHVAQDQAFDLQQSSRGGSSGANEAFDALVEGDASRIESTYVDSLSLDEQEAYRDAYAAEYDESQADLTDVPAALQALFAAPYVLGQPVVGLIAEDGGNRAVDDAFGDPPGSSEHLVDPRSYFDDDSPRPVDEPEVPDGATVIGEADALGATALFVMLSERIDPLVALTATDGWGGDMAVAYREGERTCVRAHLVGDTSTDTDEIAHALEAWTGAGPADAASADVVDGSVTFESCTGESAAASPPPAAGRALDALGLPATRSQLMLMAEVDGGLGHDEAFTFGDCVVRRVPLETIAQANEEPDLPAEVREVIDTAVAGCGAG